MTEIPVRILGIAPYEGMKLAMERAAETYSNVSLDTFVGDLEQGVDIVRQNLDSTYDCIISRGGTAELIRRVTDIPVVEIHLSVYDILRTIQLAEGYSKRYAVVGFPNITQSAHIVNGLLHSSMEIHTIHNAEETHRLLLSLRKDGCHIIVGDMITQTVAKSLGMDAFLITSGTEALQSAIEQAVTLSAGFRRLQQENLFFRCVSREKDSSLAVLDDDGKLYYSFPEDPNTALLTVLREKLPETQQRSVLRFYHNDRGRLYTVSGQLLMIGQARFTLFHYTLSKIPLRSNKLGIRSYSCDECEHLFDSSFYAISSAMGAVEPAVQSIAKTHQPVMILGEDGTGKEQIARYLYLRSSFRTRPMIVVNCELVTGRTWDYLLNHHKSPLNENGCTIYFQHLAAAPDTPLTELLSLIRDTGLQKRQRLIFSCTCQKDGETPYAAAAFIQKLSCQTLQLPTLRSRRDEITSLARLYLGSLNQTMGRQIAGFEPGAASRLREFGWPNNYTQFCKVLQNLAALTNSSYISAQDVAELLAQERDLVRSQSGAGFSPVGKTLDEIIREAILQTLESVGGNQTIAAKQLGISRTTLWRHLNRI